jgi:hypothetical protein
MKKFIILFACMATLVACFPSQPKKEREMLKRLHIADDAAEKAFFDSCFQAGELTKKEWLSYWEYQSYSIGNMDFPKMQAYGWEPEHYIDSLWAKRSYKGLMEHAVSHVEAEKKKKNQ